MITVLAHPLTEPGGLPLPPVVVATAALLLVAAVWRAPVPLTVVGAEAAGPSAEPRAASGRRHALWVVTRSLGLGLLVLAIVAGRLGRDRELVNIAPVLTIGAGWPLMVLASLLLGRVWPWLDPWDTLARLVAPVGAADKKDSADDGTRPDEVRLEDIRPEDAMREDAAREDEEASAGDVRLAVPAALTWVAYLTVLPAPLTPRTVGAALALYTIVMVGGCLAVGRRRWLDRAEVFGVLFSMLARARAGGLARWVPPRGADLVLGVLGGGLLFGVLRQSQLWGSLNVIPAALPAAIVGLLGCAGLGVAVLRLLDRRAGRVGAPSAATAAAVPVVAAVALAVGLARNRLFTSVQLLVQRASDPFGSGWDLFGTADLGIVPAPVGLVGLVVLQVVVLVAGAVAGVIVARRRVGDRRGQGPAVAAACVLCACGILSVTAI